MYRNRFRLRSLGSTVLLTGRSVAALRIDGRPAPYKVFTGSPGWSRPLKLLSFAVPGATPKEAPGRVKGNTYKNRGSR